MLSKFWKNTVITGAIDFFCLACESRMKSISDVEAHIEKPVHIKKLDSMPYVEKYQRDLIREVPSGYYCEGCNMLYGTDVKVDLHVAEPSHIANISNRHIERVGSTILAYKDISIDETAWNGFIGKTCVICDTMVSDASLHTNEKKHILNLIQSKLDLFQGNAIYRLIDDNTVQCLTCNSAVQIEAKSKHVDTGEHKRQFESSRVCNKNNGATPALEQEKTQRKRAAEKANEKLKDVTKKYDADEIEDYVDDVLGAKNYIARREGKIWCLLCDWTLNQNDLSKHAQSAHHLAMLKLHNERIAKKRDSESDEASNDVVEELEDDNDQNKNKILDALSDFEKEGVNVNFESRTVTCKKCSKNIDCDYETIKKHIVEHNKNKKDTKEAKNKTKTKQEVIKKDKNENITTVTDEMINYAKKHDLVLKNNYYYCSICSVSLTPSIKSLTEHTGSTAHKNRLKSKTTKARSYAVSIRMSEYIKSAVAIENILFKDIVINDKICLNILSFFMFTKQNDKLRCQPCGVTFNFDRADQHKVESRHQTKMDTTLVVTSVPDEFLREVGTGVLHCGFCNLVLDTDDMDNHLDSTSHRECKISSYSRLQRYLPKLREERQREKAAEMMFLHMLANVNRLPF